MLMLVQLAINSLCNHLLKSSNSNLLKACLLQQLSSSHLNLSSNHKLHSSSKLHRSVEEWTSLQRNRKRDLNGKMLCLLPLASLHLHLLSKIRPQETTSLATKRSLSKRRRRIGTTSKTPSELVHTRARTAKVASVSQEVAAVRASIWLILKNSWLSTRKSTGLSKKKKNSSTVTSSTSRKLLNYSQKKVSSFQMFRVLALLSTT